MTENFFIHISKTGSREEEKKRTKKNGKIVCLVSYDFNLKGRKIVILVKFCDSFKCSLVFETAN